MGSWTFHVRYNRFDLTWTFLRYDSAFASNGFGLEVSIPEGTLKYYGVFWVR